MCPPKNMKYFIVKIKILKRRLVLIWHQFLRNAQIEVHFSKIQNLIETNVTWKSSSRRKQHLSPIKNLFIWGNLVLIQTIISRYCVRAAFLNFSESSAPKIRPSRLPKNTEFHCSKIKILKRYSVPRRHQLLRNIIKCTRK